jgi:hypothetical protein
MPEVSEKEENQAVHCCIHIPSKRTKSLQKMKRINGKL